MPYKLLNISKYFNLEIPIDAKITYLLYVDGEPKLDYLQFVHSVVQIHKGCPNTRRSPKCKKVVQHGNTWTTS